MMKPIVMMAASSFLLAGCTAGMDMHGNDPNEYYKKHPIKNTVETRSKSHVAQFAVGSDRLSQDQISALRGALSEVYPAAVDSVQVQVHRAQMGNEKRRQHVVKLLASMGYDKHAIMFEPSDALMQGEMRLDVTYAVAVGPRCPDWRTSPVTSYSNTGKGGFGCSAVTNLGQMVADPRDLEKGGEAVSLDTRRNLKVIEDYYSNKTNADSGDAQGEAVPNGATPQ